jgi:2-dehydro-3-deoxyphosphogluconate aldolase/(4S)-4-hydroxy-2-oxoglutarate aldolase
MTEPRSMREILAHARVVPVVVLDNAADAAPIADALADGGVRAIELTLRTSAGLEAIRRIRYHDRLIVGAGTVTSLQQLDLVVAAGAAFAVSPGFDPAIVAAARTHGVPYLPGVATASELQLAAAHGIDTVKLFPAEVLGGTAMLDALAAPFPTVRFMPSGGITPHNAPAYLAHRATVAIGGGWMVPRALIEARDFAGIRDLCLALGDLLTPTTAANSDH